MMAETLAVAMALSAAFAPAIAEDCWKSAEPAGPCYNTVNIVRPDAVSCAICLITYATAEPMEGRRA